MTHLPTLQTGGAEKVTARLELDVLVVLGADLAQLEGGAHLAVDLVLFGGDLHVTLWRRLKRVTQVRVDGSAIGVEVAETKVERFESAAKRSESAV